MSIESNKEKPAFTVEKVANQEIEGLRGASLETESRYVESDTQADGVKIVAAEQRVDDVFVGQSLEIEKKIQQQKLKNIKEVLSEADKKLASAEKRLRRREVLFGEAWTAKSRLAKKIDVLTAERRSIVEDTFSELLEQYSLEPDRFFKAAQDSGPTGEFTKRLLANVQTVKKLEQRVPGASAKLAQGYGIQCFGRYPVHMLQRQLERENDKENPYGVVMYSRNDWNGAFDEESSEEELSLLDRAAQSVGLQVRIFECDGLVDTAKHLIRLNQRYGESQKIQFAIISGHGSPNSIELGSRHLEAPVSVLRQALDWLTGLEIDSREDIFPKKALEKMKHFFVENPTLILNSCLTAKGERGIAHLLASVTNSSVIASRKPICEFEVRAIKKVGEQYRFDVAFEEKNLFGGYSHNPARAIGKGEK